MNFKQEWPVVLEKAFTRFTASAPGADAYRSNLNEAIEDGFEKLYDMGIINSEEFRIFIESYTNFQGKLLEVLADDNNVFELENMIRQLDIMYKKYVN